MSQDPDGPSATVRLDRQLLDAKLSVPPRRSGVVSRAGLIDRARASGCRVVGVTAPAGYGKSTLLAEWAHAEDRRVAWVSLDRMDDDPAALLALLAAAVAGLADEDPALVRDTVGLGVSPLGRAAPRLAAALRASPTPFVLLLDDLHELRSPACHDVLGVVISGVPDGSQLVSASRAEQVHLPRLRADGDAFELGPSDLVLDASGTERVFAAAHVEVSPEVASRVAERTEGWPVGIYLASLIARQDGGDATISGDDRYVADYLQREALAQLPDDVQTFLLRTSVLDELTAPLCDAVLNDPRGASAQVQLRTLEASSLFIVPLDRRREWFRYHPLFREFLLSELLRRAPDEVMKLQLRAADWYEANGSPSRALEHLLNTSERERCVHLVTTLVAPTYQAGQISTVQRWLGILGDKAIAGYPPLAVLACYVAVYTGNTADAERLAAMVDAAAWDLTPLDGTASFDSARAILRSTMCAAGPEGMLADTSVALAQEAEWSGWRDAALVLRGEAHLLNGQIEQATGFFEEGVVLGSEIRNIDTVVFGESELALLDMDAGRWARAEERVAHALDVIREHRMDDYAVSVIGFAAAARMLLHTGDSAEAARQLTRAMRARPMSTHVLPFIAVRARVQMARCYAATGDHAAARHLLREIDDLLLLRPHLGALVDDVAVLRAALDSTQNVRAAGAPPLTPAELRVLPYLQTHLTIREIGERLFVTRNTASSEIGSIYRKLGATSRSGAVEQAIALGLLGQ